MARELIKVSDQALARSVRKARSSFARVIKQRREDFGMDRAEFSKALGISKSALYKWEAAEQSAAFPMMCRLCIVLDVTPNILFGHDE